MFRHRDVDERFLRRLAVLLAIGLAITLDEITEQHYYRSRFAHRRMYIPLLVTPLAILAAMIRAVSGGRRAHRFFVAGHAATALVGLLGLGFHWTGNIRKYHQREAEGKLPGETDSKEDRKHGRPEPDIEAGGVNVGQLLEVGARGRPWFAPLALTGLGTIALLAERSLGRE